MLPSRRASCPAAVQRVIRAAAAIGDLGLKGDERFGVNIVKRTAEQPARYIAENAGVDGAIVVSKIKKSDKPHWGYDAEAGTWKDLVAAGIVNPTKVTRSALQNGTRSLRCCSQPKHSSPSLPRRKSPPATVTHIMAVAWVAWVAWAE